MSNMDSKRKGITWVGNLYQKFEAMCLEVEDIVCEETTKYVENQVQSVGVSVKKFYAELMEDLLPPSSEDAEKSKEGVDGNPIIDENPIKEEPPPAKELEKVAPDGKDLCHGPSFRILPNISHFAPSSEDPINGTGSDLSREQNEESSVLNGKLYMGTKELTIEDKLCSPKVLEAVASSGNDLSGTSLLTRLHNEKNDITCNTTATVSTLTSVDVSRCNATQGVGKTRNELLDAIDCISDVSSASSATLVLPASFLENEAGNGLMIPSRDNSKTYVTIASMRGNGQKDDNDCAELDAILPPPDNGRSGGYNVEEMASRSDEETVNACHDVKLEESCVLVDSDELHILSQRTGKNRSYKKKLRHAFASRIRSGKKQEYERLAVLCGDIDTGTDDQRAGSSQISTLAGALDSEKSPVDFCDSDWEIV